MWRFLAVLAVAGALFASAFAAAANLRVDGGAIQAGSDDDLTCQSAALQVESYQLGGLATGRPRVEGVRVVGVQQPCVGNQLMASIRATDASGTEKRYLSWFSTEGTSGKEYHTITSTDVGGTIVMAIVDPSHLDASHLVTLDPQEIDEITIIIDGGHGQ